MRYKTIKGGGVYTDAPGGPMWSPDQPPVDPKRDGSFDNGMWIPKQPDAIMPMYNPVGPSEQEIRDFIKRRY